MHIVSAKCNVTMFSHIGTLPEFPRTVPGHDPHMCNQLTCMNLTREQALTIYFKTQLQPEAMYFDSKNYSGVNIIA